MKEDLFENAEPAAESPMTDNVTDAPEKAPKKKSGKPKSEEPAGKTAPAGSRDISLAEAILCIGLELKCPKANVQKDNNSGRSFPYRCVEDILAALAPFREKYGVFLTFSSRPVLVGSFNYITVDATIHNLRGESLTVSSSAREDAERPGYWAAQISGSCESYAKKYALQSMFMIDEGKVGAVVDTDATAAPADSGRRRTTDEAGKAAPAQQETAPAQPAFERQPLVPGQGDWMARMSDAATWKGSKKEFIDKILDNYIITRTNMQRLVAAMEAA